MIARQLKVGWLYLLIAANGCFGQTTLFEPFYGSVWSFYIRGKTDVVKIDMYNFEGPVYITVTEYKNAVFLGSAGVDFWKTAKEIKGRNLFAQIVGNGEVMSLKETGGSDLMKIKFIGGVPKEFLFAEITDIGGSLKGVISNGEVLIVLSPDLGRPENGTANSSRLSEKSNCVPAPKK